MERLLLTREVAVLLGVSARTVRRMRERGDGPQWLAIRCGTYQSARYRPEDVAAYLEAQLRGGEAAQ